MAAVWTRWGGMVALATACAAGCVGLSAPVLTGALTAAPEDWAALPPSERYPRAWEWHRQGVEYAYSAALRENARLLATGARRAAEGLEICATVVARASERDALLGVAREYRALERQSRGGRLWRPRRTLDDIEDRVLPFAPGRVELIADPTPAARPPTGTPDGPRPEIRTTPVAGTVIRKRIDVHAGPAGEVETYVLTVLQRGGAQTDVAVSAETWRATVIGDPMPGASLDGAERPEKPKGPGR